MTVEFADHAEWVKYREDLFNDQWPEIEQGIRTMAKKVFLPGFELDDIMQEFQMEAWEATRWHDGEKSSFPTLVWNRCFNRRNKLIAKYCTSKRDYTKEAHMPTDMLDWNIDEMGQVTRERLGNGGKYCQILMLETISHVERCVLFCMAIGHNINETVDQIRSDIDSEFGHREFYAARKSLQSNVEVQELMRSGI